VPARIGLIVNPVAGMGGRVGLKGTDGAETARRARALGADPVAPLRAGRALARLERCRGELAILAAPHSMGGDAARSHGFETEVLEAGAPAAETSAADTRRAAAEMERRGVELILFAGGDGTGRDIAGATGGRVPILGIPTGVKMHSGVFATSPEAAADILAAGFGGGRSLELREAEVLDGEEERLSPRLYGVVRVPRDRRRMQNPKAGSRGADAEVDALCRAVAAEARGEGLTILGPGTTTARVLAHLGLEGTLLGVDAVERGELVGSDLREAELLVLLDGRPARLVVGVAGGQGYLFGRGNQQLSPAVIRRVGAGGLVVIASLEKVALLDPPVLRVDTGDPALDRELEGWRHVRVAPRRTLLMRVSR
jgi:predicted polyphosphate/ATP-dependent NAD kinase